MTPSSSSSRPTPPPAPLGSHVSVGKGLADGAFATAREIGATTLQVFVGNPRGWALSAGDPDGDARFRRLCAEHGFPSYIHAPYLVNPGSPNPETYRRSIASVRHNLHRGIRLGAAGVVVHTGSSVLPTGTDSGDLHAAHVAAMRRVADGLLPLLEELDEQEKRDPDTETSPAIRLLLEPTAGQGRSLCAGLDDLPAYFDALERHPRLGVCLDTCHVFAAGAPLDEPGGTTRSVDRLVDELGADRLRLIHANDSADPRGSMRDRHARIGQGTIGEGAFAELLAHPVAGSVPMILETPSGKDDWAEDLRRLEALRPVPATT